VERYQQPATAKNITLHYSYETAYSLALVDEHALMQVLDNLLSNAVKYSPHGKNVFVRLRHSSLAIGHWSDENNPQPTAQVINVPMTNAPTTNDYVRIEVQDEGQGISEADMTKLFGKFARLSARPTGGEVSTGLGLSIVKKMVEAMNGRVWCESEAGKGATFIVEFPTTT
jgi:signal transduction histidine kinase